MTGKSNIVERKFKVCNKYGMHARPAALFVKTASKFSADINVKKDDVEVSGKSIMGLLTIEGYCGSMLTVTAQGQDAAEALDALGELFSQRFFEE
ncbi:MAG: HPr family phosphocarrier protein [Kiritimatiellae bacterium]|nr:HPr family phosphocarrier protein [Kiritimatiellia bacterium]MDD4736252.1 HPr family phosphocarrier protein [Kiritimatiellia bacterium]